MIDRRINCSNLSLGSGLSQIAGLTALLPAFILLSGCQLSSSAAPNTVSAPVTTASAVTVTVSGAPDTRLGASTQFTAQVNNTTNTAVTWQVNGVNGGSSASGTISAAGLYTAPAQLPNPSQVNVTAISQASTSASGQITESIWNPVPKIISISATQSSPQSALDLDIKGSAFVSGAQIQVAGSAVPTTIVSSTELQATLPAPATGTSNLAVSVLNPDPGSASSTVMNAQIKVVTISVSGAPDTRLGASTQFTAQISNLSNPAVTWQVNGVPGGSSASGAISSTGLYTAPAQLPNPATVTITAVSQASPTSSGQITESIWNPIPNITSVSATQSSPQSALDLDIKGSAFVSGAQIQVGGSAVPTTIVSSTELQATLPAPAAGTSNLAVNVLNPNPGSASSTVMNAQIKVVTISVSGAPDTRLGASTQFTAQVSNLSNPAVIWQVNGVPGGSSASGTISSTGLYTAPAQLPNPATITITAVSQASPTSSGQITESLWNPTPTISTVAATQTSPDSPLVIDILGSGFAGDAQMQVAGMAVPTVILSSTEVQATLPTPAAGTTAVAVDVLNPDPGSAASAVVNAQIQVVKVPISAAARLLDQTTFGPTLSDMQHVQSIGLNAYIAEQIATPVTPLPDVANPTPAQCLNNPTYCAQSEWWQVALTGNDQLRQRVAFALSEMFVVSTNSINGYFITPFHNILAKDAFANFSTLMKDVTLSPAMGAYLNMLNSAKPGNGQIANENCAREMMQLFTTGTDQLNPDGSLVLDSSGNPMPVYTQAQVQAFARAYTGWTYATAAGAAPAKFPNYTANFDDPMAAVESAHDMASKILLNGTTLPAGQTAEKDLDGALVNIFAHPNVGPFVCRQLIQHLVASNPTPAYVARIAAVFADNGSGVRGDLAAVVNAILMDPEARAGDSDPTAEGGHLREPILYLTAVMRALSFTNTDANSFYGYLNGDTSPLGQVPYAAPSVFNFFPPSYVIPGTNVAAPEFSLENTAAVTLRLTLANRLVYNGISGFKVDLSATSALGLMAATPSNLVDSLDILFTHAQMPANMKTAIINHISTLKDPAQRVRVATYLVITSSQYKIEH